MSQLYLIDTKVEPKSGFVYQDPDTRLVLSAESFEDLVKKVSNHRKRNNLVVDEFIVDRIHAYLCEANKNYPEYCGTKVRGLGDVVHIVAQPIAKAIDATFGTKVSGCRSCAQRRAALNRAVPFKH